MQAIVVRVCQLGKGFIGVESQRRASKLSFCGFTLQLISEIRLLGRCIAPETRGSENDTVYGSDIFLRAVGHIFKFQIGETSPQSHLSSVPPAIRPPGELTKRSIACEHSYHSLPLVRETWGWRGAVALRDPAVSGS